VKRRTFVIRGVLAAGALGVGWALLPPRGRMGDGTHITTDGDERALNGWVKIGTDGTVTIMMAKSEMGQGIHTTLSMLLADELDADWASVRTEPAPINAIYNNAPAITASLPFRPDDHGVVHRTTDWLVRKFVREAGEMFTGGSTSVADLWLPMREAGASARAMLVATAAARWSVPSRELTVERGVIAHAATKRTASFGDLVVEAARRDIPGDVTLKTPAEFRIIGTPTPRLEGATKQRGAATFGIDVQLPGMLHAGVVMCPTIGGAVAGFNASAARALPGVKHVTTVAGWNGGTAGVVAIADTPWHAMRAARAVQVTWSNGPMDGVSSAALMQQLSSALDSDDGFAYHADGEAVDRLAVATRRITADYTVPYLAHAAMEPINCTVLVKDGRATVWASTQIPSVARSAVARALDIGSDDVEIRVQYLGGGFGRRLDVDFIAQAAAIAKVAEGTPVQVLWSRDEDLRHDFYRPASVARYTAGFDASGALTAWSSHSASQSVVSDVIHRYFGAPALPVDRTTVEGAFDQPYAFPAVRAAHTIVKLPVPVGYWRSVGYSHTTFFTESFMDEVAAASSTDPVALRLSLLQQRPRHAAVLGRVAELANWTTPLPAPADGVRHGRGVALHESYGSVTAQVAEVEIAANGSLRVTRMYCVIDCGFPVNPTMIRQQVEGGIVFGLSAALHGEITIENGRVVQGNYDTFRVLRLNETPEIVVEIMPSTAHPTGVGEPPVPPVAPAVANAIFAATGQRLRSLPLRLSAST
jgi:isoquinoline 1-oxidoreductase beta subunit